MVTKTERELPLRLASLVALLALGLGLWGIGVAATDGARFSVQPLAADSTVPAPETYFILDAQQGQTLTRAVRVTNFGDAAGAVRLFPVDATTGATSGTVYRGETDPRNDVGAWIAVDGTALTLDPGQSQDIPVTITVPASPRSGQHLGGIVSVGAAPPSGGQVTITSQLIVPVLVNLPPPLTESFTIPALSLGGSQTNPGLLVGLRNDGTVLQKPTVNIVVTDLQGRTALTVPSLALDSFVPQTQIGYPVAIAPNALPAGDYRVTVSVTYGSGTPQTTTTATFPLAYYYVPTLTTIGPISGDARGGATVTLTGFGFGTTTDTQVFMDGTPVPAANILSIAARSIRFTAPAHMSGNVIFTVKVGGALASGSMHYQYSAVTSQPPAPHPAAPTQTGVSPGPVSPHPTVVLPGNSNPPPNGQPARH